MGVVRLAAMGASGGGGGGGAMMGDKGTTGWERGTHGPSGPMPIGGVATTTGGRPTVDGDGRPPAGTEVAKRGL